MSSSQLPPPQANFSFPPSANGDGQVHFNYIDSFVTSWATPASSSDPCFFSLYYWNGSNPDLPWTSRFNLSASLNGTTIVPLNSITSGGLGQLNLNYVNPVGSHQKITGAIFNIDHDPTQPKAMTWNANALSSTSTTSSPPSTQTTSMSSSMSVSSVSITTTSSSTIPSLPTTSITLSQVISTPVSATLPPSSTPLTSSTNPSWSHGALVASILLGILLALLITALISVFFIRRRRRKTPSETNFSMPAVTIKQRGRGPGRFVHETDAGVAVNEVGAEEAKGERGERWELEAQRG